MDCRRKRYSRRECDRWNTPRTSNPTTQNYTDECVPIGPFAGMDLDCDCNDWPPYYWRNDCGAAGGCPAPVPPCHHLRPSLPPPRHECCPYDPCCLPPDYHDMARHRMAYCNRQRLSTNQRFNDCADAFFKEFGFGLGNAKTDAEIERKLHLEKFMRAECGQHLDECFGDYSKYGIMNLEKVKKGDFLVYKGRCIVQVEKVYKDHLVPYFDVKFRDGTIRQTEGSCLKIPPCSPSCRFHY